MAQFGSVAVSCEGGVTVGTSRATAVGLGAIDVGEGADSLGISPRIVKRAISKYQARGPRIDRTSYKATTSVNILTPADT